MRATHYVLLCFSSVSGTSGNCKAGKSREVELNLVLREPQELVKRHDWSNNGNLLLEYKVQKPLCADLWSFPCKVTPALLLLGRQVSGLHRHPRRLDLALGDPDFIQRIPQLELLDSKARCNGLERMRQQRSFMLQFHELKADQHGCSKARQEIHLSFPFTSNARRIPIRHTTIPITGKHRPERLQRIQPIIDIRAFPIPQLGGWRILFPYGQA